MQGKILIIDGISTNRIVLKVKLAAAFYQIIQAGTISEAIETMASDKPDLVISALALPDGTIADLCKTMQPNSQISSIPVLAIGSTYNEQARMDALEAGAFDIMYRPLNETLLLGRVRSLIRMHHQIAEWQTRDETNYALGLAEAPKAFLRPAKITFVGMDPAPLKGWVGKLLSHLRGTYTVTHLRDAMAGFHAGPPPDAIVLSLPDGPQLTDECLRLIPALRVSAQTRGIALLVIQNAFDPSKATSALDMGADDVMISGFHAHELALRLKVLLQRKQQVAHMLQSVRTGLRDAVNDPLTGLYNRRYALPFISNKISQSATRNAPFSVILADMDHFKNINDVYGHASGDAVLVETARRLRNAVRQTDVIARIGGEEFLIAMPATDLTTAHKLAERICSTVGDTPFNIPGNAEPVSITISLGLTVSCPTQYHEGRAQDSVDALLDRADKALYRAKLRGRNCVTLDHPHSRPAA